MSLEANHAAAGTAATIDRVEVKQEWYKKPTGLHFAIAAGVIAVALIINYSFEFNFFWKLLLGWALIWGGGRLKNATIDPAKLWGKILSALGWVIIVVALLNSGVRAVVERGVIKANETLNELATTVESIGTPTASAPGTPQRLQVPDGEIIPVPMQKMGPLEPKLVRMRINDTAKVQLGLVRGADGRPLGDGVTSFGICAKVTQPAFVLTHPAAPKQHVEFVDFKVGWFHDLALTKDMKAFLLENDVTAITITFHLILTRVGTPPVC